MRICDICKSPDHESWKPAVVRITVERIDPTVKELKSFTGWDVCTGCLPADVRKEVEVKDEAEETAPGRKV
jgi:hypothetical protein